MKLLRVIDNKSTMYKWIDIIIMTMITILSIYDEKATIFYVIYLFWWNEFLDTIINRFFDKRYKRKNEDSNHSSDGSTGFLLTGYLIFIVAIFGFIANWNNKIIIGTNFEIIFFKNIYFNFNLLFMIVKLTFFNLQVKEKVSVQANYGFTPNMIVLHISIILGAFALFFVVRKFPEIFTPENTWASILIISPFLLLRFIVQIYSSKK